MLELLFWEKMEQKQCRKRSLPNGLSTDSTSEPAEESFEKVYLDYNATTPLEPSVLDAIYASLKYAWGNPSSSYSQGKMAKKIVNESRKHVAEMINADQSEIVFTSGGTEANNMVFHSVIQEYNRNFCEKFDAYVSNGFRDQNPHVITSIIEHDSVILALKALEKKREISLSVLPVSKETGQVDLQDIFDAIRKETVLVSIMLANNETGVIQVQRLL